MGVGEGPGAASHTSKAAGARVLSESWAEPSADLMGTFTGPSRTPNSLQRTTLQKLQAFPLTNGPMLKKQAHEIGSGRPLGKSRLDGLSDELLLNVCHRGSIDAASVANLACTNRRMAALAKKFMWKDFCWQKAPKMTKVLLGGSSDVDDKDIEGGWAAYAKLMRFCPGGRPSPLFDVIPFSPHTDRLGKIFSKSSGRRLLGRGCRKDILYITETCDHVEGDDEVGIFRGIFKEFSSSCTRRMLASKKLILEDGRRCPFCAGPVWSLAAADLVPVTIVKSLNCYQDNEGAVDADVFVCVHGHLHGMCILADLDTDAEDDDESGEDEEDQKD